MHKPQNILDFEKKYEIELREIKEKKKLVSRFLNYYLLNDNYEVIGLSLFGNRFTEVPDLKKFKQLEILNLNYTRISKIEALDTLQNLQQLTLYNNQISTIEGLNALKNLKYLSLISNQISTIENLDTLQNT